MPLQKDIKKKPTEIQKWIIMEFALYKNFHIWESFCAVSNIRHVPVVDLGEKDWSDCVHEGIITIRTGVKSVLA